MANLRLFTETPPGVSDSPSLIQFYFKVESVWVLHVPVFCFIQAWDLGINLYLHNHRETSYLTIWLGTGTKILLHSEKLWL